MLPRPWLLMPLIVTPLERGFLVDEDAPEGCWLIYFTGMGNHSFVGDETPFKAHDIYGCIPYHKHT